MRLPLRSAALGAVGVVLGAIGEYLLDPDRGKGRRRTFADQAVSRGHRTVRHAEGRLRYRRNELRGAFARARGAGRPEPVDDVEVKQLVHQALRRAGFSTGELSVEVSYGKAVLRGQMPGTEDIDRATAVVSAVPGVVELSSLLHTPDQPAPNKAAVLKLRAG